jgi:hypothetical protein
LTGGALPQQTPQQENGHMSGMRTYDGKVAPQS